MWHQCWASLTRRQLDVTVPKLKSSIQEARLSSTFLYKYTSVVFSSSRRQHTKLCTADIIKCPGRPFSELKHEETAHLVWFSWGGVISLHQNPCQLKLHYTDRCFFLHENNICFKSNMQILSLQLENPSEGVHSFRVAATKSRMEALHLSRTVNVFRQRKAAQHQILKNAKAIINSLKKDSNNCAIKKT